MKKIILIAAAVILGIMLGMSPLPKHDYTQDVSTASAMTENISEAPAADLQLAFVLDNGIPVYCECDTLASGDGTKMKEDIRTASATALAGNLNGNGR